MKSTPSKPTAAAFLRARLLGLESRRAALNKEILQARLDLVAFTKSPAPPDPKVILETIHTIKLLVCAAYGQFSPLDLESRRRPEVLAEARHMAMTLAYREISHCTLEIVATAFGGRDHGTVMWAIKHCAALCDTDPQIKERYQTIRAALFPAPEATLAA